MTFRYLLAAFVLALGITPSANALSNDQWTTVSDVSTYTLVGSALAVPALRQDWVGLRQGGFSIAASAGISALGKAVVHEERPDNSDNNSFPSSHTANSFAAATTLYRRYGWQLGFPAYALATVTGAARVAARKHYWWDALAGAAIGGGSGWLLTDAYNDKVQLVPWASSDGGGMQVMVKW